MSVREDEGIERVTYLSKFSVMETEDQFMNSIHRVDPMNIIHYRTHRDDINKVYVLYFIRHGNKLLHYAVLLGILSNLITKLYKNPHQSTLSVVNKFLTIDHT